uniref:NADH dehydrogenase subunit 4L n=1 Tax=Xiphinema americanum TaxID=208518 RepID=Q6TY92_XIPAM|nr:NADH dehydrogenase subunit 4L [Xiphinema americanum]AAQ75780.1 NADH dehydrogenase subunit 4L [Xiphinema americanum]
MVALFVSFMVGVALLLVSFSVFKWSKPLLVIVLLEGVVVLLLCLLFQWVAGPVILAILSFFVGEALILLTSFFSVLRWSGSPYGSIFFY